MFSACNVQQFTKFFETLKAGRQADGQAGRQAGGQPDRQAGRQADGQAGRRLGCVVHAQALTLCRLSPGDTPSLSATTEGESPLWSSVETFSWPCRGESRRCLRARLFFSCVCFSSRTQEEVRVEDQQTITVEVELKRPDSEPSITAPQPETRY